MTLLQGMALYRLFGWLMGYGTINLPYLLIALFTACIYVIYDTQIIIERAEHNDKDVPTHTMMLFIDLFELFVRIIQILIKLQEKEDDNNRRKRN